jgi:hypothetical protein
MNPQEEYPIDERGLAPPDKAGPYIDSTTKTLAVWRHQGKGPRFIKRGARVFYSYAELDRYHRALPVYSSTAEYVSNAKAFARRPAPGEPPSNKVGG